MPSGFDAARFNREMQAAQRRAQAEAKRQIDAYNREVDRVNRENQRRVEAHNRKAVADYNREVDRVNRQNQREVEAYNRKAAAHNQRVLNDHNRQVDRANAHNQALVSELNRQLRAAASGPRYTVQEQVLADRIQRAVGQQDPRDWDAFLSYARIDGADAGNQLRQELEALGVSVWFDEIAIRPGQSQSLQMDRGLAKARSGIVLLTPAYLVGRFWTERELGALLHKNTLIPVLHGVSFAEVQEYSGILPDLAGFETARDSVAVIAKKIAAAVLGEASAAA
jgi:hypothetical protein